MSIPALEYFKKIGEEIPDLILSKMFGAHCFKTPNGKAVALVWRDFMVTKLAGAQLEDALHTPGASMFTPMEGRAMNGWVQIPFERKKEWPKYLEMSADLVRKIPAKPKKSVSKKATVKK